MSIQKISIRYIYYTQFRDKYLPLANKQDKNNLVALHDEILFFLQFTTYIEYLQTNQIYCNNEKYILLLTKMKELKNSKTKEDKSPTKIVEVIIFLIFTPKF